MAAIGMKMNSTICCYPDFLIRFVVYNTKMKITSSPFSGHSLFQPTKLVLVFMVNFHFFPIIRNCNFLRDDLKNIFLRFGFVCKGIKKTFVVIVQKRFPINFAV